MNYVLDDKGNKIEAYSKEEILSVLQQCIDDGSLSGIDAQSAFVSKLKCCVGGDTYPISFVTQAKYNELKQNKQLVKNQLYFITDDMTEEVLEQNINDLWTEMEAVNETIKKIIAGKVGDVIFSPKKLLFSSDEGVKTYTFSNRPAKVEIVFGVERIVNGTGGKSIRRSVIRSLDLDELDWDEYFGTTVYANNNVWESEYIHFNLSGNVLTCPEFKATSDGTGRTLNKGLIFAIYEIIE